MRYAESRFMVKILYAKIIFIIKVGIFISKILSLQYNSRQIYGLKTEYI